MLQFKRIAFLIYILSVIAGCSYASNPVVDSISAKYYFEKNVTVCGYVEDRANISKPEIDGKRYSGGLSLINNSKNFPAPLKRACFVGKIEYVGCGQADIICTDWAYPYAIRVE